MASFFRLSPPKATTRHLPMKRVSYPAANSPNPAGLPLGSSRRTLRALDIGTFLCGCQPLRRKSLYVRLRACHFEPRPLQGIAPVTPQNAPGVKNLHLPYHWSGLTTLRRSTSLPALLLRMTSVSSMSSSSPTRNECLLQLFPSRRHNMESVARLSPCAWYSVRSLPATHRSLL